MSNTIIGYGNQQYQVTPEFRSALTSAAYNPEDSTITPAEFQTLESVASTPEERAFLNNHVRINPGLQQGAEFDPNQLSFSTTLRQSPESQDLEQALSGYSAENPLPVQERTPNNPTDTADTIPEFVQRIQQLPPEERPRLERLLAEKTDQSARYYLQNFDQNLTAVAQSADRSPSGGFTPEQQTYIDQRYDELMAYEPYRHLFSRNTLDMMNRVDQRVEAIMANGNRNAPAATEASSGPPAVDPTAERRELSVGAGFAYSVERVGPNEGAQSQLTESSVAIGAQYTWVRPDYSVSLTGGARFSDREQEGAPLPGFQDPTRPEGTFMDFEGRVRFSQTDRSYSAYASTDGVGLEADFLIGQRDNNPLDDPRLSITVGQSETRGFNMGVRLTRPIG